MKIAQLTVALLFASVTTTSMAQADSGVGVKRQALGEQCSMITQYQEAQDSGGCGPSGYGTITVAGTAGLEGNKTYSIKILVTDELDQAYTVWENPSVVLSRDGIYRIEDQFYSPGSAGRYQFNMEVRNANTGAVVCSSQSLVSVGR